MHFISSLMVDMDNSRYDDCKTYQTAVQDKQTPIRDRYGPDGIYGVDNLVEQDIDDKHEIVETETEEDG